MKYKLAGDQEPYLYCYQCRRRRCPHIAMVKDELQQNEPSNELDVIGLLLNSPPFPWIQYVGKLNPWILSATTLLYHVLQKIIRNNILITVVCYLFHFLSSVLNQTVPVAIFRQQIDPVVLQEVENHVTGFVPVPCASCGDGTLHERYVCRVYYTDRFSSVTSMYWFFKFYSYILQNFSTQMNFYEGSTLSFFWISKCARGIH